MTEKSYQEPGRHNLSGISISLSPNNLEVVLTSSVIILSLKSYQFPIKPSSDLKNVLPGVMSKVLKMPASGNTFGVGCCGHDQVCEPYVGVLK